MSTKVSLTFDPICSLDLVAAYITAQVPPALRIGTAATAKSSVEAGRRFDGRGGSDRSAPAAAFLLIFLVAALVVSCVRVWP
ncbi:MULTISPECIES: hypothetical protein [Pseudofrankia]|uniref:hypothetical protein n=1 Tax=Pseudofrankia TaxID=2994363 RepID=UPI0004807159|nr:MULTISPECIES: hypothetical protein [Pseudofrankia]OHV29015.1 hypothetical protein BCD49_36855 [Pseudofrankia sp. EUN1h]